jgi:polysaccharide export outer membrane protein
MWGLRVQKKIGCLAGVMLLAGCSTSSKVPNDLAAQSAIVPANVETRYLLGPGDRISVNVYGQQDMSLSDVIIDPQGRINMPFVGFIEVDGIAAPDVAAKVTDALKPAYLRNPHVTVNVIEFASRQVVVDGQVRTPSVVKLFGSSTLTETLVRAGGPDPLAKLDEIVIIRNVNGERMAARFDLRAIQNGTMEDPKIYDGDRVFVGYNSLKGLYQDAIRVLPFVAVFQRF